MLENQEPKPELTLDEKIAQAGLTELATTPIKPLVEILGYDLKFYGYVGNVWFSNSPDTTLQQELVALNKVIKEKEASNNEKYATINEYKRKVEQLDEWLNEEWDSIDEEVRDKLCDIFGLDQEVTKTISIMVKGTIDITAPRGYDWENIEEDLNPCVDVEISNSDLEVSGYGFSHDDTEITEY